MSLLFSISGDGKLMEEQGRKLYTSPPRNNSMNQNTNSQCCEKCKCEHKIMGESVCCYKSCDCHRIEIFYTSGAPEIMSDLDWEELPPQPTTSNEVKQ